MTTKMESSLILPNQLDYFAVRYYNKLMPAVGTFYKCHNICSFRTHRVLLYINKFTCRIQEKEVKGDCVCDIMFEIKMTVFRQKRATVIKNNNCVRRHHAESKSTSFRSGWARRYGADRRARRNIRSARCR